MSIASTDFHFSNSLKLKLLDAGFDSDLCVNVNSEWSSENENYRLKIRQSLIEDISKSSLLKEQEVSSFKDLSCRPEHPKYSISISHCRDFGGYVYLPKPAMIGFDVECLKRVTSKIADRITNARESLPIEVNPAFVWVAKEAAFKAIQNVCGISVIQDVIIENWKASGDHKFEFNIANLNNSGIRISSSKGCVMVDGDLAFAVYFFKPNNLESTL